MSDLLSEELMLNSFFKPYADLGHWFNAAHDRCARCGRPTIDLYEDGIYGDVRRCPADSQTEPTRATVELHHQEGIMARKETSQEISTLASRLWREDPLSDAVVDDIISKVRSAITNGTVEDAREAIRAPLRDYVNDVQSVAASAVSQDETSGGRSGRPTEPIEDPAADITPEDEGE